MVWAAAYAAFVCAVAAGRIGAKAAETPLAALMAAGGVVFVVAARRATRADGTGAPTTGTIWAVGLTMRLCAAVAPPFGETDAYRYLWDGAVVASGGNPYVESPDDAMRRGSDSADGSSTARLAREGCAVLRSVNHPHLTTVYPPVAQAAFAAAHLLAPWRFDAWRLVVLAADATTMLLLLKLLETLGKPAALSVWYWWCPIVVREVANVGHMDPVSLPFALGAVLLSLRGRAATSGGCLALAAGAKLWPVLLVPAILRPPRGDARTALRAASAFVATAALVALPVLLARPEAASGFGRYAAEWCDNSGFFQALRRCCAYVGREIGRDPERVESDARVVSAALLAAWGVRVYRRRPADGAETVAAVRSVVTAAFMLSPTQFPWYWIWVLPWAAAAPSAAPLAYAFLLSGYYLQYQHPRIVWLEHAPAWALAAGSALRGLMRAGEKPHV